MTPVNLQQALSASSAVTAITGTRISRTTAPQDQAQPYVVWTPIANTPENSLSCSPDIDNARLQVDCYARDQATARKLAIAARGACEAVGDVQSGPWEQYEPDTKLFRWTFDLTAWEKR